MLEYTYFNNLTNPNFIVQSLDEYMYELFLYTCKRTENIYVQEISLKYLNKICAWICTHVPVLKNMSNF